ncbi:duf51 family protein [Cystoisospora suis]|uniref:Duf51 family protein n=1 Tax=Cystoisospora suis TaxID=483139 RepID=A0A2C6KGB2_9APIC|nr:duf51 family protein [Cystoisospora suis]
MELPVHGRDRNAPSHGIVIALSLLILQMGVTATASPSLKRRDLPSSEEEALASFAAYLRHFLAVFETSRINGREARASVTRADDEESVEDILSRAKRSQQIGASPGCKDVTVTADFVRWGFDILISRLKETDVAVAEPETVGQMKENGVRCPAFFTWYGQKDGATDFSEASCYLRGCIGTLSPIDPASIGNYAWMAASQDPRFPPVTTSQVSKLKGTMTLLHSFELTTAADWELGVHGLTTDFTVGVRAYSGVFLPDVMLGFATKEKSLEELVRKAGYFGPITPGITESMRLTRFQGRGVSLTFPEYKARYGVIGEDRHGVAGGGVSV